MKINRTTSPAIWFPDCSEKPKTVIVAGVGRGGTSFVAGLLSLIGIDLGVGQDSYNFEDDEFVKTAQGHRGAATIEDIVKQLVRIVHSRNKSKKTWGWKDPSSDEYIEFLLPHLRNPHVIFVNRDIAAIAISEANRHHDYSIEIAYNNALSRFSYWWTLLQRNRIPTLLISFEKALANPTGALGELSTHLQMAPPTKEIERLALSFSRDSIGYDGRYKTLGEVAGTKLLQS